LLPRQYVGVVDRKSSDWVGYSKTGEWNIDDILPFRSGLNKFVLIAMKKCTSNRIFGNPLGLHEVVVVDDVKHRKDVLNALFDNAIQSAESREIYTAQYPDLLIMESLLDKSFQSDSKPTRLPSGIRELYVRPLPKVEPEYEYEKEFKKPSYKS
jgi:hypothetical protein